jgi:hypothetical protein
MQRRFWRRLAAVLALVLGVGVAAPAAGASARPVAPASTISTAPPVSTNAIDDWWW